MNSLLILAQMLASNKDGNLTPKQIECANTMHSAGLDLLNLINDILDLSKVEAGKIELQFSDLNLSDIFNDIRQKFQHLAAEKNINFNLHRTAAVPDTILTDGQRLRQIINNLLSNAFKFTPNAGTVNLEIDRPTAEEDLSRSGLNYADSIVIHVSDSGIGIPKDKQQVIFEAFQQADGTTSRRFGGTGLGLSISRQLVQLMGGEIKLHSVENQGSCFSVFLPQKSSPTTANHKTEISNISNTFSSPNPSSQINDDRDIITTTDKSILIIEDDHNFANLLINIAKEKDFKCLYANNGRQGVELAVKYTPQAIMLDVGLPQLDGWTVMKQLKNNAQTRHIPVHFISGSTQHQAAKKMGAIGYALKPVSVSELDEILQRIESFIEKKVRNILLIADKHQANIIAMIDNQYVNIILANSKIEAKKQLSEHEFDCIILDLGHDINLESLADLQNPASQIPIVIYTERELQVQEMEILQSYTDLTVKTVNSLERLLDEATLFLHQVESKLPEQQRQALSMIHDKETILKHKKVLLVDDDARNVFALATILEDKDMEILMAENGKLALQELQRVNNIDIILMDIMMPEMDGFETIKLIRQQARYRKTPIIALTAKAMKGDANKCIQAGASDYLAKPVDTDKLLSLMRVWLSN